ncbi:hypothetical protein LCGC14_0858440 [marine sediment metagenome]|uniref:Uncharacterized protein n=1 Tax=marine sediment metagenome TaxID=412755 RepID=A0A0F9PTG6_9ZZZZ
MNVRYVGFEFAPVEGWEEILPAPKAPSNWKDPEKIEAHIARKLDELRDGKAGTEPLSGSVSHIHVLAVKTESKHHEAAGLDVEGHHVGAEFYDWFCKNVPARRPVLVGLKIRRAMQLIALDVISTRGSVAEMGWALGLGSQYQYNALPGYIDPLSVLFGSSDTDLDGACRRLGLPTEDPGDAVSMALLAVRLGKQLGLS